MAGSDDPDELLARDDLVDRCLAPEELEREFAVELVEEPREGLRQPLDADRRQVQRHGVGGSLLVEQEVEAGELEKPRALASGLLRLDGHDA